MNHIPNEIRKTEYELHFYEELDWAVIIEFAKQHKMIALEMESLTSTENMWLIASPYFFEWWYNNHLGITCPEEFFSDKSMMFDEAGDKIVEEVANFYFKDNQLYIYTNKERFMPMEDWLTELKNTNLDEEEI